MIAPDDLIQFPVRGTPRPYGSTKEKGWRSDVANAAREWLRSHGLLNAQDRSLLLSPPDATFKVQLSFFIVLPVIPNQRPDNENLAKPVIDTLFFAPGNNKSAPTGILFPTVSDFWVFHTNIYKELVPFPADECVQITIGLHTITVSGELL